MEELAWWTVLVLCVVNVSCYYDNSTLDAAARQIVEFKHHHPVPIGLHTTSTGEPVEVRDTITLNTDIFDNTYHLDLLTHTDGERIPERVVHAKGIGAYGFFQVTHDVSKYTNADIFNGIGKKTKVFVRFSIALQNLGGSDLGFDFRGMAVKFYSDEGNLDLLCLQNPVYLYRDPIDFSHFVRAFRRNPITNLFDNTMRWDFLTLKPVLLHAFLWINSDYGSPRGYRRMNAFPIHTFEISNKHGERYYVKFNFITEQGLANFTAAENMAIGAEDPDYFSRDLYNAIANKNYPSWRLEMDIMSAKEIKNLDYNPFDVTRLWKKGDYHTVPIGRLILDKPVENHFKDSEQSAYCPSHLVPGIPGPVDFMFKSRKLSYLDVQNYRIGRNHNRIIVNSPKYRKTYNRDGFPPVRENMKDVPNYYPNSFSGPIPYVDSRRPQEKLLVLESNAIDLEPASYFYNHIVESDAHRQRIANNLATSLLTVAPKIAKRGLKLLTETDPDLGKRTGQTLKDLKIRALKQSNEERFKQNAQCLEMNMMKTPIKKD